MYAWLPIIILAYFFFGLASFGDKLVLSSAPRPKMYIFYVGLMGAVVLLLLPFIGWYVPSSAALVWIILEPIAFLSAVYFMYVAIEKFDVSRVVPAIGAVQPVLIFLLALMFFKPEPVQPQYFLAFLILLAGSFIISASGKFSVSGMYARPVMLSAFLFAMDFIFLKFVFLHLPFWQGIFWTRLVGVLTVIFLLVSRNFRKEIFAKREFMGNPPSLEALARRRKTGLLFIFTQLCGGAAGFLQSFAISLAPASSLAIMNSLKGLQYVFLLFITLIFSFLFPKILREEVSRKTIIQKSSAIGLIAIGLALLVLQ